MRYFWVGDKEAQDIYEIKWHPGHKNLADYQSKHHIGSHHLTVCPGYLHEINSPLVLSRATTPSTLKGCVGNLPEGYIRNVPLPRVPWDQSTFQSRVPPVHMLPVYYKETHIIPTYNSTCRIGERVAYRTLPNGNLLPLILRTTFCLISMAVLMPSLHSQQWMPPQVRRMDKHQSKWWADVHGARGCIRPCNC
jgi:hypothetical protein